MTIRSGAVFLSGLWLLVFDGPAAGQAMVEYGVTSAAAAGSVGALKGMSNTLNGIFGSLDKVVAAPPAPDIIEPARSVPANTPRPSSRSRKRGAAKPSSFAPIATPGPPPPDYEDPRQIQAGMGYDEVIRRFGPPQLQFTSGMASQTVTYLSKTGPIQVVFEEGKVTSAPKS